MSDLLNKLNITDPELTAKYHKRKGIVIYDDASEIVDAYEFRTSLHHMVSHIPVLRVNTWMDLNGDFIIHLSIRRVSPIFDQLKRPWVLESIKEINEIKALVEEEMQLQNAFDDFEL